MTPDEIRKGSLSASRISRRAISAMRIMSQQIVAELGVRVAGEAVHFVAVLDGPCERVPCAEAPGRAGGWILAQGFADVERDRDFESRRALRRRAVEQRDAVGVRGWPRRGAVQLPGCDEAVGAFEAAEENRVGRAVHVGHVVQNVDAEPIQVEMRVLGLERIERPAHAGDADLAQHLALVFLEASADAGVAFALAHAQLVRPVDELAFVHAGDAEHEADQRAVGVERTDRDAADFLNDLENRGRHGIGVVRAPHFVLDRDAAQVVGRGLEGSNRDHWPAWWNMTLSPARSMVMPPTLPAASMVNVMRVWSAMPLRHVARNVS